MQGPRFDRVRATNARPPICTSLTQSNVFCCCLVTVSAAYTIYRLFKINTDTHRYGFLLPSGNLRFLQFSLYASLYCVLCGYILKLAQSKTNKLHRVSVQSVNHGQSVGAFVVLLLLLHRYIFSIGWSIYLLSFIKHTYTRQKLMIKKTFTGFYFQPIRIAFARLYL